MKTALVLLAALASMTILDIAANTQAGSKIISLTQSLASTRTTVMPANKNRGHGQPRKLRTAALPLSSAYLLSAGTTVMTTDWNPGPPTRGDTWTTSVPIAGRGRDLEPNAPVPLESRFCRVSSGVSPWPPAPTGRAFCAFRW
jgi:hypothetical protein